MSTKPDKDILAAVICDFRIANTQYYVGDLVQGPVSKLQPYVGSLDPHPDAVKYRKENSAEIKTYVEGGE